MSQPNDVVLDFNESISFSPAVAAAYRRTLSSLVDMPAFVDRVFQLHEFVDSVYAWRYANCITGDQMVWMLRSICAAFQRDPGIIGDIDFSRSAIEVEEHEAMSRSLSLVD
ncbi:hypothetical protein LOD50_10805 [Xylella fastidiosa subsp. multiplex]|uniref:Uncharacterized protein n=1 Tax=Xylella fastidiosa subsp. multiplex TaxID=644357 RepID=A0AAW6HV63_XYLFS|nr:hypothetical protein [Xylella fastidiosa]MDC6408486.1 hypothetical protein [Xylella fastidiosa subsp. multiplex]MDD0936855.1 hypothetical protein [Xylella fastidiosa subsp. multiplex]MSS68333.1 hypothetical protein [Xylella fastidiosa subsp. multiplex]